MQFPCCGASRASRSLREGGAAQSPEVLTVSLPSRDQCSLLSGGKWVWFRDAAPKPVATRHPHAWDPRANAARFSQIPQQRWCAG